MKNSKIAIGKGEMWAILAAFSYALTNVVLKWALADTPALFGAALKTMPVWTISIIVFFYKGYYKRLNPKSKDYVGTDTILLTVLSGSIVYIIGNLALNEALKRGAVTITSPMLGTQVIWATMISYFFLKEKINLSMITGMIVSIIGVVVLTMGNSGGNMVLKGWETAIPLTLIAAVCYSSGGSIKRYLFTKKSLDPWIVMFLEITAGELLLNIIFLIQGNNYYSLIPFETIGKSVFAGVFEASAIISLTMATSLTQIASATTINSMNNALAPLLAVIVLGEKLNMTMALGIALIMGGVIFVQLKKPADSVKT